MPLPENSYIIVIDELTDERRQVAHEVVKAKANGWWHNFPNVWIVGGHNVSFWRDELRPVITGTGGSILVMSLPAEPEKRAWAFYGPKAEDKTDWLFETYTGQPAPTDA